MVLTRGGGGQLGLSLFIPSSRAGRGGLRCGGGVGRRAIFVAAASSPCAAACCCFAPSSGGSGLCTRRLLVCEYRVRKVAKGAGCGLCLLREEGARRRKGREVSERGHEGREGEARPTSAPASYAFAALKSARKWSRSAIGCVLVRAPRLIGGKRWVEGGRAHAGIEKGRPLRQAAEAVSLVSHLCPRGVCVCASGVTSALRVCAGMCVLCESELSLCAQTVIREAGGRGSVLGGRAREREREREGEEGEGPCRDARERRAPACARAGQSARAQEQPCGRRGGMRPRPPARGRST